VNSKLDITPSCLTAAPATPAQGMLVCADGNNWQPGGADQGTDDWMVRYCTACGDGGTAAWIGQYNITDGAIILDEGSNDDAIEFVIDGGGSALTTGVKGFLEIPYSCTINSVTILADQSGSVVVDLWVDTYANYPPTDADTITASAVPTITTATKAQDTTLTGWSKSLTKGSVIGYNVDSATTVTRVTISLKVDKL